MMKWKTKWGTRSSVRYVLRNLHRRRARTLLGALGIFLTLSLLTAIQIGLDSVSTSYTDLVALQAGKADVLITAAGSGAHGVVALPGKLFAPAEVEQKLSGNPLLRGLAPRLVGLVQVRKERGEAGGAGGEGPAVLIGLNPARERELDISGLFAEPALREGTCAISESLAKRLQVKSGSPISVRAWGNGNSTPHPALPMNLPDDRSPLTLPSPPMGERVSSGRAGRWFRDSKHEVVGENLSPIEAEREERGKNGNSHLTLPSPPAERVFADLRLEIVLERQLLLPQEVRDFIVVNEATARSLLGEPERVHVLAGAFRTGAHGVGALPYDVRNLHASVLRLKEAGESLAADLGMDYDVRLPKATAITAFQNLASPLRAIFGVFALLALSVTGLLIYSIISVAVEERIREYAILRTLGGRRRDIVRLVLSESVLLCALGVVPGVLAGLVVAQGLVKLVALALRAKGTAITLELSPAVFLMTLLAGVALSVGSALLPALQAAKWQIVDALDPLRRGQIRGAAPTEWSPYRPLVLTGVSLSALSVVVFFVLPTAFLSGNPLLIGTVVLCLLLTILLGFTLVALGALPLIERIILTATGWAFGPAAELAGRNLVRHQRRNTTTALMFILSVSLVIFIASVVVLFSRTSMTLVEHFNGADLRLESEFGGAHGVGALPAAMKNDLARVEGVVGVSEVRFLRSRSIGGIAYDVVISDLVGMKHLWIVPFGIDRDLPKVLYLDQVQYAEGGPEAFGRLAADRSQPNAGMTNTNSVLRSEHTPGGTPGEPAGGDAYATGIPPLILSLAAARFLDVHVGDLVQLSFQLGSTRREARFRIAAVCGAVAGFDNFRARVANAMGSGVLIPLASFQAMTEEAPDEALLVRYFLRTGAGPEGRGARGRMGAGPEGRGADEAVQKSVARKIRDQFDVRYRFGIKSAAEQKEQARTLYWVTQVLFGLLLIVAIVISVFALIASLATAVMERRWEVGVLKALGLRRGQLFRMFLGEAVVLTLSAGFTGGLIGFTMAWLFVLEAGALIEVPIVFTMPYVTFLITFAISLLAGAVAAHLPTRRLLRKPPAEILRLEG